MNNKRATKRALLTSVMALVMCVVMLVGTTFAWFTDTASTAVNKIQAGNLDVALEMKDGDNWVSAEGKTLQFKTADSRTDNILWEPGCTYELPQLRVVNKGNLALKYMIKITGIKGDAKLNEVIKWTITDSATNADIVTAATDTTPAEYKLLNANDAHTLTIMGEMDKNAGNEYQGLSIDGISITVYATQYTYEKDSINDQYDANAAYKGSQEFTSGTHVLNKGGVALNPNDIAVKVIGSEANVTITGGYYDGGSGGNNICVAAANGATVTIKDGTFTVGGDANGYGNSVVYSQGGNITIEGGFFYTNYSYDNKYYVLNQKNDNPGTITVKGGTFVNYNPAGGDDNVQPTNFVAPGYSVITETKANGDVWYTVVSKSNSEGLKTVLANGGELTVSEKIETNNSGDTAADRVIISKPTTLNLKAKIVSPDNMGNNNTNFCALIVDADTTINAGENGGIDTGVNGGYGINVRNGATLTINGGSYYGGGTTVQVQKGTLIINGGHFACEPYSNPVYGSKFLINCIDSAYKDGSAKIIIKGGTFVNFDPSDSASENPHGNFVADGYKVVPATQTNGDIWYTVVAE